jgi:hypothetical protein
VHVDNKEMAENMDLSQANSSIADPDEGLLIPLADALHALTRSIQNMAMYPFGHPLVEKSLAASTDAFQVVLEDYRSITLAVTRDQLILNTEVISESSGDLQDLAMLLYDLDIMAFEVRQGLHSDELSGFLQILTIARRKKLKGQNLAAVLVEHDIERIVLHPIQYDALRFTRGINEERESNNESENLWLKLSRLLSEQAFYSTDSEMEEFANRIMSELYAHEGIGVQELKRTIHNVIEGMRHQRVDLRNLINDRLATFVSCLNEDLRNDLLRYNTDREEPAARPAIPKDLPIGELVGVLRDVDHEGNQSPEEMLRLVKKLGEFRDISGQNAPALEALANLQPGSKDATEPKIPELRDVLKSLFERCVDSDFNPINYKAHLDKISETRTDTTVVLSKEEYGNPNDLNGVLIHAAEIAVQILARPGNDQVRESLFTYIEDKTDLLIELDGISIINEASTIAEMCCLMESCTPLTRKAAEGYLYGLKAQDRVEGVVRHACRRIEISQEHLDYFRIVGTAALVRVVDARAEQGFESLQPIFHLLRKIPPARSMPILQTLLDHHETKVRVEALKVLLDIDICLENVEKYLRIAMEDQDRRNEMGVLEKLGQNESPMTLKLLEKYIQGELSSRKPTLYHCRYAAGILASRGKAGQSRLFDTFCILAQSLSTSKRASLLVEILESSTDDPTVLETLKTWKRSVTYRMYLTLSKLGFFK